MDLSTITERDIEIDDFMRSVRKMGDECWLWIASWDKEGYGMDGYRGRSIRAHRLSYQFFKGDIPEGLVIDHLCRIKNCVNPDHLEAVTRAENKRRGAQERHHYRMLPPSCAVMPEDYEARMAKERAVRELPFFKELDAEYFAQIKENKRLDSIYLAENGGFESSIA